MDEFDLDSLTLEEHQAIRKLELLAKRWPKSLWLYSASGTLYVMRCGEDDPRSTEQKYAVISINIPNDGGDW
jgi:hypothetical protein